MSIQDESFPQDDLELSRSSGKNFVFPHYKPRRSTLAKHDDNDDVNHAAVSTNQNMSSSSLKDQDDSTQSLDDCCPPSETSGKTNASEPNDLQQEMENKKSQFMRSNSNKSISYQDIHSEYTKRRYKHVESKVGQYIANMKAQDQKRRNSGKFQRHRSMPETLHGTESTKPKLHNDSKTCGIHRHSISDLDRVHELQSDHEIENYDNLTATTSSSTRELGPDAGIYLDKLTYEQLLNDKERMDYLQIKLQEKNAENCRLKQNLDTMRIEYSMCKDKLKQQVSQSQRFSGSFGSIGGAASLGRSSLQCLLYPQETKEKATQTERLLTPSPIPSHLKGNVEMFATPLTPESNNSFDHAAIGVMAPANHKVSKTITTIQALSLNFSNLVEQDSHDFNSSSINNTIGFLRQRSNSIAARKKSTPLAINSSAGSNMRSSSDSAIDSEATESPKSQRQSRREEFIYYDKRSQRYAVLETRNASKSYTDMSDINSSTQTTVEARATNVGDGKRGSRKRHNLRSRMMRLFGSCTKCEDPNLSLDTIGNSNQQSFSQIPLLEKSLQNSCRNVR